MAGKGGVGKTTVSAVIATMAAKAGVSTLLVELDGKAALPGLFGVEGPFGYEECELIAGKLRARRLTPDDALLDYLADHGMGRISKRLVHSGALDIVATAVPGLRDILVLGKIKQLEREGAAELIIVDAPATGHAMSALTTPQGLADAVSVGPIRVQAQDVIGLLSDKVRCSVILVTLPEETPVNESIQAAYEMEDKVGVNLGPIIINGIYPEVRGLSKSDIEKFASNKLGSLSQAQHDQLLKAAEFRIGRHELQNEQLERLSKGLPLPQLRMPYLFTTGITFADIELLSSELAKEVERLPSF